MTHNGDDDFEGAEFIRGDDGSITARGTEIGLAHGGDTRAEALPQPAGVLVLHEDGGELTTDDDLEELGFDPDEFKNRELPDFMRQMVRRTFSNHGVTRASTKYGYISESCHGSHVWLRYEHPETREARNVDMPQYDEPKIETLRSIAGQCDMRDFHSRYEWIERAL